MWVCWGCGEWVLSWHIGGVVSGTEWAYWGCGKVVACRPVTTCTVSCAGVTPVVIQPPATSNLHGSLPALKMITELSNSRVILSTHNIIKLLRSKVPREDFSRPPSIFLPLQEVAHVMDLRSLPPMYETEDLPRKKLDKFYKPPTPELIAYLDFTVSTTGVLSGVKVSKGRR